MKHKHCYRKQLFKIKSNTLETWYTFRQHCSLIKPFFQQIFTNQTNTKRLIVDNIVDYENHKTPSDNNIINSGLKTQPFGRIFR